MYNTHGITPETLNYKTYQDLSMCIKKNLYKLPKNVDLIVGIPRSGMIPATMLSMILSRPLCTLREFVSGDCKSTFTKRIKFSNDIKSVLIVDDSISSGKTMFGVKELIKTFDLENRYTITYMVIYYKTQDYSKFVDIALQKVDCPRLFQWNYLNHLFLQDAAFDLDGVLCQNPTKEENNDSDKYHEFILNAKPLFIPQYKIPYIITSRLSKYESETREWLNKNNVLFDNLIMLSGYTAEQRRNLGLHAVFKAEQYGKLDDIQLFIESDRKQAKCISKLTGKLCFCVETDELFGKK